MDEELQRAREAIEALIVVARTNWPRGSGDLIIEVSGGKNFARVIVGWNVLAKLIEEVKT